MSPPPRSAILESLQHSARTAIAAATSLLVALALHSPEPYWAAITTLVVMQSTLGAALTVSASRFAGTAMGAVVGAVVGRYFGQNVFVFASGVFLLGLACAALRLDRPAYRFAGITLAIVTLVTRTRPAWVIALHRFAEVSLGIAVALLLTAVWPERDMEGTTKS
jgi:uncharacterized membrane protein YccC